ncbi:aldehyde dehydrogenase [Tilletiaria anomala UBC 951]|uniref:Aldehyde dehydrogenase n=1 Tax=Tilletiaria anomala (strain ATCC 24038 / CBS 436.72 / UBC 951) TaxID=1037660 RepID=A0A066WGS6_TILAU|nr:aldehyde dehydrogenase [Tilletiaria anomala UBC 951]KDN53202.1 aldehyde dehydrogenase [Tilletiaria anomala UBC 951]
MPIENPANGTALSRLHIPSPAQLDHALHTAQQAFLTSRSTPWSSAHVRSAVLHRLSVLLSAQASQLAEVETLQTGRCIREMKTQLSRVGEWFEYYAALIRTLEGRTMPVKGDMLNTIERQPLGVVLQVIPFNHPLLIAVKKISVALAAGNSVIVKASELAPLTVLTLGALAREAGVPDGLLTILPGPGAPICNHLLSHPSSVVRKIDLTGGTATGRVLGRKAGELLIPYTAELGGKAPLVVFDDVPDVQSAVAGASFASFVASGQTCVSATRVLVQQDVYDQFVASFIERAQSIERRMGDPSEPCTSMGSLISRAHMNKVHGFVHRAIESDGFRVLAGGAPKTEFSATSYDFAKGAFYPPTLLTLARDAADIGTANEMRLRASEIWKGEVFGPVVLLCPFRDEEHAVELANDCQYGLGASIWTESLSRAHRVSKRLANGVVWVNGHHRNDPSSIWGGFIATSNGSVFSASGLGRENGLEALHAYTQSKSITFNLASAQERRANEDWFAETVEGRQLRYG